MSPAKKSPAAQSEVALGQDSPPKRVFKAKDLIELLKQHHSPDEWAFLEQVANGTGQRHRGWADALTMNLWPSRGLAVHGFEVKVSRSDFKRELEKPDKAENIARFCDYWWLVIHDAAFVGPGELPDGWGLMAPQTKGGKTTLKVHIAARKMKAQPLDRTFVAAVLRCAHKADEQTLKDARLAGWREGQESASVGIKRKEEELSRWQKNLHEITPPLEELLGLKKGELVGNLEFSGEIFLDATLRQLAPLAKASRLLREGRLDIQHLLNTFGFVNQAEIKLQRVLSALNEVRNASQDLQSVQLEVPVD